MMFIITTLLFFSHVWIYGEAAHFSDHQGLFANMKKPNPKDSDLSHNSKDAKVIKPHPGMEITIFYSLF